MWLVGRWALLPFPLPACRLGVGVKQFGPSCCLSMPDLAASSSFPCGGRAVRSQQDCALLPFPFRQLESDVVASRPGLCCYLHLLPLCLTASAVVLWVWRLVVWWFGSPVYPSLHGAGWGLCCRLAWFCSGRQAPSWGFGSPVYPPMQVGGCAAGWPCFVLGLPAWQEPSWGYARFCLAPWAPHRQSSPIKRGHPLPVHRGHFSGWLGSWWFLSLLYGFVRAWCFPVMALW